MHPSILIKLGPSLVVGFNLLAYIVQLLLQKNRGLALGSFIALRGFVEVFLLQCLFYLLLHLCLLLP